MVQISAIWKRSNMSDLEEQPYPCRIGASTVALESGQQTAAYPAWGLYDDCLLGLRGGRSAGGTAMQGGRKATPRM